MSRSFSIPKLVSAFTARRGIATATLGVASSTVKNGVPSVMLKKGSEESAKTAWIPDPVTGYYRPEDKVKEIDPAELREILLNNKTRGH